MNLDQSLTTILVRPKVSDMTIINQFFSTFYGEDGYLVTTVDQPKTHLVKFIAITIPTVPFKNVIRSRKALKRMGFSVYEGR